MIKFIKEYLKNPRVIGAVAPSSRYLAKKMIEDINFSKCKCIVEYGPGTGVFTEKIIEKINNDTIILLIETNVDFAEKLRERYFSYNNVFIINDSAENVMKHLKSHNIKKVDYVVSGLPFTSLPTEISNNILEKTKDIIKDGGKFITFQYSLLRKNLFLKYFSEVSKSRVYFNFPPAYVLQFTNHNKGV